MAQDLRSALERLDSTGSLIHVAAELNTKFELAAVLWKLKDGPTVVFDNVKGHSGSVVGNLLNTRDKLAISLGIGLSELQATVAHALENPLPPEIVPTGTCMEVEIDPMSDLSWVFPVPSISEFDAGPYISAGVLIARNPESGQRNMAICRMQILGPGRLGVYMAPTHSRAILEANRALGTKMEVAIALGLHPGLMVASQFLTPLDELEVAGGLFGEPIRLVQARTVNLEVPADAEIIIEGTIDPDELESEGPFGEFPGTYAPRRENPVIRISAISTRRDPIFQMIVGGRHPEHLVTGAIAREAGLFKAIKAVVPGTQAVMLTEGGTCRFHAVVSIRKRFDGEGRLAILAAFTNQDLIKLVTVVDDDIDISDPSEVEWALATRMRANEDIVIVQDMKSNPVDLMSVDRTITKLGIDATLTMKEASSPRPAVGVPTEVLNSIDSRWNTIIDRKL